MNPTLTPPPITPRTKIAITCCANGFIVTCGLFEFPPALPLVFIDVASLIRWERHHLDPMNYPKEEILGQHLSVPGFDVSQAKERVLWDVTNDGDLHQTFTDYNIALEVYKTAGENFRLVECREKDVTPTKEGE